MEVTIPGCIKVVLDKILEQLDDKDDLRFVKRKIIAQNPPKIRRDWRFIVPIN